MLSPKPNQPHQLSEDSSLLLLWDQEHKGPREGLLCVVTSCANRDCPCTEVTLDSYPVDQRLLGASMDGQTVRMTWQSTDGQVPDLGENFTLRLDFETGVLRRDGGDVPSWVRGCVDAALLDQMYAAWLRAKAYRQRSPVLPSQDRWQRGQLLGWCLVFPDSRPDVYLLGDKEYLADTLFCIEPDCSCTETHVVFMEMEEGTARDVGGVMLDLTSWEPTKWWPDKLDRRSLERLLAAFRERHRRGGALHERRRRLRELGPKLIGEGRIVPVRTEPRVGRNDPCPCGSGKKFKRCCA